MGLKDERAKLIKRIAQLEAHKAELQSNRGQLQDRAGQQLDSMHDVVGSYGEGVSSGKGGFYAARRHRTLLTERSRLQAIVHEREALGEA